jgi:hypothetical protein
MQKTVNLLLPVSSTAATTIPPAHDGSADIRAIAVFITGTL